jgi:flagellar protein FliL
MSTPEQVKTEPKKRSRLIPLLLVALAAGGGGGWYWWQGQRAASAAGPAAHHQAAPQPVSLLPLETFTVNLADPGASRYLRTTVQLVLAGTSTAGDVARDQLALVRTRSAVLELLTTRTAGQLTTLEGKSALKADLARDVSQALGHEVTDVLFTDFVVQ